MPSDGSVNTAN